MSESRLNQLELQLNRHIEDCDVRFKQMDKRAERLIASQEKCTEALNKLTEDTHEIVQLYGNAKGAVAIGVSVQKFGLWLIKWPLIGTGLYTIYQWVIKNIVL